MKDKIIGTILGITLGAGGVLATTPAPMPELTNQQLYILTEIVNDRVPQVNTTYSDVSSFTDDYIKIAKLYKDNFTGAVDICSKNKSANECNLFLRIKDRIAAVK